MVEQVQKQEGGETGKEECPNCHSKRSWKDGLRETTFGVVQRNICRDCGFRFSEKSNIEIALSNHRQLCAIPAGKAKKLDSATEIKTVVGGISEETSEADKEFKLYLQKQGFEDATVRSRVKLVRILRKKGAILINPESVLETIAKGTSSNGKVWSNGYKQNAVTAIDSLYAMLHIQWKPPFYVHIKNLPFIPTEKEIDALISGTTRKVATSLQLLKETGMRIGEAWNLTWTDIDIERNSIRCRAEKHGNPREFKISAKLLSMLNLLPKTNDFIFEKTLLSGHRWNFDQQRKKLAIKLQNPRLNRITFHTFRHWFATTEYAKTNSLLHVSDRLGHRNINSTMVYTHLVKTESDQYYSAIAKTTEEAQRLIEDGFSFVCITPENIMLFRKPK